MRKDNVFEMASSSIRFGAGATREIGWDLEDLQVRRAMVLTDPHLVNLSPVTRVREALEERGIGFEVFDRVRIEPTDESFQDAIRFAQAGGFDGFVAVGGGSVIDTAKAANLYSTYKTEDLL